MTSNQFPKNNSNAQFISEKVLPKSKLVMKRFEYIFDLISEEPVSIIAKEKEGDDEQEYMCILRIRIWNSVGESCAWNVYSVDREELNSIIVRKVMWDMDKDVEYVKKNIKENRNAVLEALPSIVTYNKYILPSDSNQIIKHIEGLDKEINKGFVLSDNRNPKWEWRDLEVLRLYNWGQVHITWCPEKKNEIVEDKIKGLTFELDSAIGKHYENINSMTLNYDSFRNFK